VAFSIRPALLSEVFEQQAGVDFDETFAPVANEHIDHFLRSLGLQRCEYDPNVYVSASTTLTDRTDSPLAIWNSKQSAQNDAPIILLLTSSAPSIR